MLARVWKAIWDEPPAPSSSSPSSKHKHHRRHHTSHRVNRSQLENIPRVASPSPPRRQSISINTHATSVKHQTSPLPSQKPRSMHTIKKTKKYTSVKDNNNDDDDDDNVNDDDDNNNISSDESSPTDDNVISKKSVRATAVDTNERKKQKHHNHKKIKKPTIPESKTDKSSDETNEPETITVKTSSPKAPSEWNLFVANYAAQHPRMSPSKRFQAASIEYKKMKQTNATQPTRSLPSQKNSKAKKIK